MVLHFHEKRMISMQQLRHNVLKFITGHGLFRREETVVVACSGGADSMALLDILASLSGFRLTLVVAHLNHMLRGTESDGDEQFVRAAALRYEALVEVSGIDVAALAKERSLSLEEAGREARYSFFRKVAAKHSASAIAVGHHRDDQVETVLMRLIRGAGGSGLAGMRPRSGEIVRPLLCLNRDEIEAYLRKRRMAWRDDVTNADIRFVRNRIRHELLPLLESMNPEVVQVISQSAEALAADEEILGGLVLKAFERIAETASLSVRFDLTKLFQEPPPLRKRLYRTAIGQVKGDLKRISFIHLADIDSLVLSGKPNGELHLPAGIRVVRVYDSLLFTRQKGESFSGLDEILINGFGDHALPCGGHISVSYAGDKDEKSQDTIFLESGEFPFPWVVRYFRKGDRFSPRGMDGSKKVKDLFIDRKIPLLERTRTPLLICKEEIIWVCGIQPSQRTRPAAVKADLTRLRIAYTPAPVRL
jgi:tRNA(Ile)-lysidine synthase